MTDFRTTSRMIVAAGLLAVALPLSANAQDAASAEPGQPYVAETFSDWDLRCIRAPEEGTPERCEMFQLMRDEDDNAVSVFRVNVPFNPGEGQVATALIMTPLETLLAPGIRLRVDDGEEGGLPFTMCDASGCMARIPMNQTNVDMFQAGGDAFIQIFALVRGEAGEIGGVPVPLTASLRGFTAAYEALQARHEELVAFIRERQAEAAAEE
ncbi:invasion associated family protein [Roseibacterium elongatum DSM 19469]|uniref:Invasion associated family protein n=1 Tax=Roseicyclus elongatus DSM 19469 TaxID=1294273 RepID=W8RVG4_9RHOB|nr:invasion associated locus B family protein [Roseibacterium elongatum]AHM05278.1 invasion associated family protein [Roseibacterium elongatum DSM 19469]